MLVKLKSVWVVCDIALKLSNGRVSCAISYAPRRESFVAQRTAKASSLGQESLDRNGKDCHYSRLLLYKNVTMAVLCSH